MQEGRDHWWHRLLEDAPLTAQPEAMDSEDLLFILYTSGTTGKPKGIVHTTGGYLTQAAATTKYVFDLKEDDVFWCTADIGWVTGHSYVVYGPLANGATVLMYEGAPDWPERDRFWSLIERYGVTVFYTAPTAIRAFMKWGTEHPARHDLSHPPAAGIGRRADQSRGLDLVPRADRRQALPHRGHLVADRDRRDHDHPAPRRRHHQARLGDDSLPRHQRRAGGLAGQADARTGGGFLTLTEPWPGMLRTIYGDDQRYRETYWSRFPGRYFAGDGAKVDDDGLLVDPGPGGRRAERGGAPHRHDGGGERAGGPSRASPRPRWSAGPTSSRARRWRRS